MEVTINSAYPWGRSFDEYRRMFLLTDGDLRQTILGCADGPASFNVEASAQGARVVSVDPLYKWTASEIRDRIAATSAGVLDIAASGVIPPNAAWRRLAGRPASDQSTSISPNNLRYVARACS